ncbi:hypothetical protein [Chromatium okenii]|nr:hypothetical protein [Chromatium okenii]
MRRVISTFSWLVVLTIIAVLTVGSMMLLDHEPLINQDQTVTPAERAWVKQWLANNPPRRKRIGDAVSFNLSERQTNLIANTLLTQFVQDRGRVAVQLEPQRAQVTISLALPWDPNDSFVNLAFDLVENGALPKIDNARLAGLPMPSALVQMLADRALAAIESTQSIQHVSLQHDQLAVNYLWRPDLLERIGSGFVADAALPTLLRYQRDLSAALVTLRRGRPVQLADLLKLLFTKAAEQPDSADPVAENRAVILVLAAYVNGHPIRDPADTKATRLPYAHPVLLRQRQDLGQHFMTSAALVTQGGDTFSGMIGWYKEMSDANGGSGFSFADMSANRAGIRLAQRATASPDSARQVQQRIAAGLTEDDFMPVIDGLPEGMDQQAFAANFGNQNNVVYQKMIQLIDERINAARLFRPTP